MGIEHLPPLLILLVQLPAQADGAGVRVTRALEAEGCECLGRNSYRLRPGLEREPLLRELAVLARWQAVQRG